MILGVLGAILIAAKVLGYSSLSWAWTLSPLMAIIAIWVATYISLTIFYYRARQSRRKR
jgi:hypothetical protein